MTQPEPAVAGQTAKEMQSQAGRLGPGWLLRSATVVSVAAGSTMVNITYDGDDIPVPAFNLSGGTPTANSRVFVLFVPPHGNYIISLARGGTGYVTNSLSNAAQVTSNSATEVLVDSITWTAISGIRYRYSAEGVWFGGAVGADQIGLRVRYAAGASVANSDTQAGGDRAYDVPVAAKYLPLIMSVWLPPTLSGQYTIGLFIRRVAGTAAVGVERVAANAFSQEITAHMPQ